MAANFKLLFLVFTFFSQIVHGRKKSIHVDVEIKSGENVSPNAKNLTQPKFYSQRFINNRLVENFRDYQETVVPSLEFPLPDNPGVIQTDLDNFVMFNTSAHDFDFSVLFSKRAEMNVTFPLPIAIVLN